MNSAPKPQAAPAEPRIDRSQILRQVQPEPDTSYSFERRPNPVLLLLFQLSVTNIIL